MRMFNRILSCKQQKLTPDGYQKISEVYQVAYNIARRDGELGLRQIIPEQNAEAQSRPGLMQKQLLIVG